MDVAEWLATINLALIGWIVGFSLGGVREAALDAAAVLAVMLCRSAPAARWRTWFPRLPLGRRRSLDQIVACNPYFLELVADWRELNALLPQQLREDWRAFRSWVRGRRLPDPGRLPPPEWPDDLGDLALYRHYEWRRVDATGLFPVATDRTTQDAAALRGQ